MIIFVGMWNHRDGKRPITKKQAAIEATHGGGKSRLEFELILWKSMESHGNGATVAWWCGERWGGVKKRVGYVRW